MPISRSVVLVLTCDSLRRAQAKRKKKIWRVAQRSLSLLVRIPAQCSHVLALAAAAVVVF